MGFDVSTFRIVPELVTLSVAQARADLAIFGFTPEGGRMVRGDQVIALVQAAVLPGHGAIDHLALKAVDTDAAGWAVRARGARVDPGVTPDGPLEIAEFWGSGVRYQFLQGPGGARVEICARRGGQAEPVLEAALLGHDHIGLCCRDIAASAGFYGDLGLGAVFQTVLQRAGGAIAVRFLRLGSQVLELYSPPGRGDLPGQGLWRGLRFEGLGRQEMLAGPDGELITLV